MRLISRHGGPEQSLPQLAQAVEPLGGRVLLQRSTEAGIAARTPAQIKGVRGCGTAPGTVACG